MKTIYFIINAESNHRKIINSGSGASEFLFYLTAYKLSKYFNIIIFNRDTPAIIDNIQYLFLPDNCIPDIENINNSVIIIQRHFQLLIELHKLNYSNKYILWSHDYFENNLNHKLMGSTYNASEINNYFYKNNINIISVSDFHKKNIQCIMKDVNIVRIYNALFSDYYPNNINDNNEYNKNNIIFASNWGKGLNNVLKIGIEYYKKNSNFKLILLKPIYCDMELNITNYPFINCIGTVKNKEEYCKILQNCLCVLTTSYSETFGCAFAEALHLNVPVIGDNSIKSGFSEIIQSVHMCNFNNINEVINKIEEFHLNRPIVTLDKKFYDEVIIDEWKNFINIYTD
jgi:hypothetical protein